MQPFEFIENALNVVLIVVNTLFISILIGQFRDSKKPSIVTHVATNKRSEYEIPNVLEFSSAHKYEHHYIRVTNASKNEAKKLEITYKLYLKDQPENASVITEKLDYLNPFEMTQIILATEIFREKFPDKFEKINIDEVTTLIRPKDRLNMKLDIDVKYNPLFLNFRKHVSHDNYTIEWSSLPSDPYDLFNCWNQRKNVQAKMRVNVKRLLKKYGYPPDMQKIATQNILEQAELVCKDVVIAQM